jgi:hypothetical protein
MSLKPSPEVLLAVVMAVAVWGWYGFPGYFEGALILVALGCISAFMWKKSQR